MKSKVQVIGVGTWDHGDDAVALEAAGRIRDLDLPGVVVHLDTTGGGALLEHVDRETPLILVTSTPCADGLQPGACRRCDWPFPAGELPRLHAGPSGALDLVDLLDVAAQLGRLPNLTWIYLIAVCETGSNRPESREVLLATPGFVQQVADDIQGILHPRGSLTANSMPQDVVVPAIWGGPNGSKAAADGGCWAEVPGEWIA